MNNKQLYGNEKDDIIIACSALDGSNGGKGTVRTEGL